MFTPSGFYDKLLLLPLFQGIGREEFLEIAGRIRIGFQKETAGRAIVRQDEQAQSLYFVLNGELMISRESDDRTYRLDEWMSRPTVIEPEALFGLQTCFSRSYSAAGQVELLKIEKAAVRDLLFDYPTFRINYLNLLSAGVQRSIHALWRSRSLDVSLRFQRFLAARCLRPAGRKILNIRMEQLADELLETRLTVSRMLHRYAEEGVLTIGRGKIEIPLFEKMR